MTTTSTFKDLYLDELKDLWSANDQMHRALSRIAPKASNEKVKSLLQRSQDGIGKHTQLLKSLIESCGGEVSKEHCKGMEGLVAEAIKHTIDEAPTRPALRDAAIIAQFQRMTHYGITGFGTAAAFAKAMDRSDDAAKLSDAVGDMWDADEVMSDIAEQAVNEKAAES